MSVDWSICVLNYPLFWIMRENPGSNNYCLMKKPSSRTPNGIPLEYFSAPSEQKALEKGIRFAVEHGLMYD